MNMVVVIQSKIFRPFVCFISLLLLLSVFNVTADEYLDLLESEADGLTLDRSGQLKQRETAYTKRDVITKKKWKWEGDLPGDVLPDGLAQDEFATLLKQRFFGTFVFYRRLNLIDQQSIYKKYQQINKPDISVIRGFVLKYSK